MDREGRVQPTETEVEVAISPRCLPLTVIHSLLNMSLPLAEVTHYTETSACSQHEIPSLQMCSCSYGTCFIFIFIFS